MIDDVQIIVIPGGSGSGSQPGAQTSIGPVISSEVGDLEFAVPADTADISVAPLGGSTFFSASLCTYAGKCTLYQAGDVIADYMKSAGLSFGRFSVSESASGSSAEICVMLSDRVMTGGFKSVSRFPLVSSDCLVVPSYGVASLYFYSGGSEVSLSAVVNGIADDGSQVSATVNIPGAYSIDGMIAAVDINPSYLVDYINDNCRLSFDLVSLLSLKISCACGGLYFSASVYVIDDPDMMEFRFLNNFGLQEHVYFHAEAVPQLSQEADSAFIGHRIVQYDVENEQSFSVQATNISADEWPRVSQFVTSREVLDAYGRRIILSDVSSEIGKTYDGLGSLKFSYRFADTRIVSD